MKHEQRQQKVKVISSLIVTSHIDKLVVLLNDFKNQNIFHMVQELC